VSRFDTDFEIAHIIAGHEKKEVSRESLKSSQKINQFEYEKRDELFADVGGLRIALDCITNKFHPDPAVVFCAPIIFFKLNQIMDKSIFMLRTGKPTIPIKVERAESYPPPVERIMYVEETMKRLVGEQHLHLGMTAMLILETLWKYVPPLLSYRAKHGHVLHKRFNFRFKNV
jgi:hypothetical protein